MQCNIFRDCRTLQRFDESVASAIDDIEFMPNGSGTILIRRSRTDAAGEGAQAYLSQETVKWLDKWLHTAGIDSGSPVHFRGRICYREAVRMNFGRFRYWLGAPQAFIQP
jgi:hypothetical protein